jgi:hypothetical protein
VHVSEPQEEWLPDITSDEAGGFDSLEDDLRENVPPHHL